ncbi:MAG TPA: zinc-ribbon domain-containing protein [Candidatus Nanoarchaeia archaeon]|nr:zinc-ribbon domain-containing protein [Candidatus Nanoarchaeia archaeon]
MFFKKKSGEMCGNCNSKIQDDFSYCPYCGKSLISKAKQREDYGLLGAHDGFEEMEQMPGFTDKMISSLLNSVIKNLDKQLTENAQVTNLPNGIKIKIGSPALPKKKAEPKIVKRTLTEDQMKRLSSLPRKPAKTNIKRLGDRVIYELTTPGVVATEDVFVSRLESGYEVKALGSKKMYVNTLPISLPIKTVVLEKNKVIVEFNTKQE